MNALGLYESMKDVSAQMVLAAEQADWDTLVDLEKRLAHIRDQAMQEDTPNMQHALDEATRSRKIELIQAILANDREIRRHTEPWMASMRELLGAQSRSQILQRVYRP